IILTAVAISLLPTLVVIVHLKRSGELCELDRALWRLLLLWGGPLAGAAYLTVQDRRISDSPAGQLLRLFLDSGPAVQVRLCRKLRTRGGQHHSHRPAKAPQQR